MFGITFQQYTVSIFPFPYFDIYNANLYSGKLYWFQNKSSSKWNLSNNCWLDWQWRNSLKIYVMSRWLWFTINHSRWVLLQSVTVTLSHQWLVNKTGFQTDQAGFFLGTIETILLFGILGHLVLHSIFWGLTELKFMLARRFSNNQIHNEARHEMAWYLKLTFHHCKNCRRNQYKTNKTTNCINDWKKITLKG